MIECIISQYFKSAQGRVVLLERKVNFPAVPFVGSYLSLKNGSFMVEHVHFCEDSQPILALPDELTESDSEIDHAIEDQIEYGWSIQSDILRKLA
jgi:hypothetical protein